MIYLKYGAYNHDGGKVVEASHRGGAVQAKRPSMQLRNSSTKIPVKLSVLLACQGMCYFTWYCHTSVWTSNRSTSPLPVFARHAGNSHVLEELASLKRFVPETPEVSLQLSSDSWSTVLNLPVACMLFEQHASADCSCWLHTIQGSMPVAAMPWRCKYPSIDRHM